MIRAFVFGAALMLGIVGDHAILAQNRADLCPPRYRRDPVATNQARAILKARMRRQGFPERLLNLLDRYECVACLENASADFHITVAYHDDDRAPRGQRGRIKMRGFRWDPQTERGLREDLAAGRIKAFYILNTATRCRCCPDDPRVRDEDYPDWNRELDMHMGQALRFESPRDLGPLPPDLVAPPSSWLERVPAIQQYEKPARRVVQVLCRACQPLADRWNTAAGELDALWDSKVNLLDGLSVARNTLVTQRNEISRLQYEQMFEATKSPANLRRIDELRKMNEDLEARMERDDRRVEEIERSIAEQQQRMDAIMKELLACEEKCKTAALTDAQAQSAAVTPTKSSPEKSPAPPPVATDTPPQAPGAPGSGQAACPDCAAAAAEVARLGGLIAERTAEVQRLQADHDADMANLENLWQLRANAERRGQADKVRDIDRRIADLKAASKETRSRIFRLQEDIRELTDQLEAAKRTLEKCNDRCGGAVGAGTGGILRPPRRTVAVKPLTSTARCQACAPLLVQLQQSHRELERLAQRANDRQFDEDFEAFEEQRVKVADYERQLAECNNRCATATSDTTTSTTGGTGSPVSPGTPVADAPPILAGRAACPACEAAAAKAAQIGKDIQDRNSELARLRAEHEINMQNLNNLYQLLAQAAERADSKARIADIDRRVAELKAESQALRTRMFEIEEQIRQLGDDLDAAKRDLENCNSRCAGYTGGTTGSGMTGGGVPRRTVVVKPLSVSARCQACQPLLVQLQQSHASLVQLAQRANDRQLEEDFEDFEEQRAKVADLERDLAACNQKCATTTAITPSPCAEPNCDRIRFAGGHLWVNDTGMAVTDGSVNIPTYDDPRTTPAEPAACFGSGCGDMWRSCADLNTCSKIDEDCGVPGTCSGGGLELGPDLINLMDPGVWGTTNDVQIDLTIQIKMTDVLAPPSGDGDGFQAASNATSGYYYEVPPTEQPQVRQWFNPLGLLARRLAHQIERWRGSVGPRPLLTRRDLELAAPYTSGQAMGLPKGVHLLLTDRGGSTGKTLGLQVLNFTGKPVRLSPMPFAIQPIRQQAQARVQQAFNRLAKASPVNIDLSAYCVEFLKLPPAANQIFRLAPANVQKKYEAMSRVLRSAYRVQHAGLLRPDSNPAAYTDSIKQWSLWAVEQGLNESRFTEAFLAHTKKNVEAAGQKWSKAAEDVVRKVSPNRWRDIFRVLQGAGIPVAQ